MTGHRQAHPLLISLANLDMGFRTKASNHAFLLLALLPIPKFIARNRTRGVLDARLFHKCLDFILEPLKNAAKTGIMMRDPVGNYRYCFPMLASYIADTPEAALVAGVAGKTSSVTMASYKQFGDPFRHEPRTATKTLSQLRGIDADPWDLDAYIKAAAASRLNGVHLPFWRDWALADPSQFLTPEPLHHWHKQFWDHDVKWCIYVVGGPELDFRFSILQPRTGFKHFSGGISTLKQVTGREHRDIERSIVAAIAGAVPKDFLIAIRALMDFRYLAQAQDINAGAITKIENALAEFHRHKDAITEAGARRGKNGPITNWQIPKLEFFQSVAPSIEASGTANQWSADITEHAHITEVKGPARATNNQNYESQMCRHLDREERIRQFDLATALRTAGVDLRDSGARNLLETINPVSRLHGTTRNIVDYFSEATELRQGLKPNTMFPFRTFAETHVAFHLMRDPSFRRQTVDEVSKAFNLPDLHASLADYIHQVKQQTGFFSIQGRRATTQITNEELPFSGLEVWTSFRLQSKAYHGPHQLLPPQTINAAPPCDKWPHGRSDAVVFCIDPAQKWPHSGIKGTSSLLVERICLIFSIGHQVGQLRLIIRIVSTSPSLPDRFLAYIHRLDIVPQLNPAFSSASKNRRGPYPDPATSMFLLRRATRTNGSPISGIIPLRQVRALADLIPRFGAAAERRLTPTNHLAYPEFWLNKYFNKDLFYALDCQ